MKSNSLFLKLETLMMKYRFKPDRKKSQNFIIDESTISKVIEKSELNETDLVLEIGPGTGFLTKKILETKAKVTAVEFDKKLFELLTNEISNKNLNLINEDILQTELPEFNKCVSFPPYHISKKIISLLIEKGPELCILVFQKEFSEKILAEPGFWDYSAMSVKTQYAFEVKRGSTIRSNSFFPKPKTDSMILILKRINRKLNKKDELKFFKMLDEIFRYKNKNIDNVIRKTKHLFKEFPDKIPEKFLELKVVLMEVDEFFELFEYINNYKKI